MMLRAVVSAVALLGVSVTSAHAAVMTFNTIYVPTDPNEFYDDSVHVENGITATSNDGWAIGYHDLPDAAHLDDGNTGFTSSITFTMLGRFDATSFDLFPLPTAYCSDDGGCNQPYENVGLVGLRDGIAVAQDLLYMGTAPFTYLFDSAFTNLDSLVIQALFPNLAELGGDCWDFPCGHFDIDNVRLSLTGPSPVPLPAPFLLLLAGLGGLGLLGRIKNSACWQQKAA